MGHLLSGIILWAVKIFFVLLLIRICGNAFENKIVATVFTISVFALYIILFHVIDEDLKEKKAIENERVKYINTEVYKKSNVNRWGGKTVIESS